jgi:uncharacterized membrane protein
MLGFVKHRDLLITDILSLTLLITILVFPDFPLRIVVGAFFVLFFPGYTLISSLFPRRKDLDSIERIALSIGLSLAVVPLIGLALNYTPWGIRLIPVLLSLLAFTLSMSIVAFYRREKLPASEAFNPPIRFKYFSDKWHNLNRQDRLLTIGIIACLVVAGGLTAHFASMPRIGERFTEFYVLGPNGKISDYPTKLPLGESGTVILGIVNHEYETVNYTVKVKLDGETIATINGITLNHEEKWEQKYTFTPHKTGDKMKLEFLLYKNGEPEPYRQLHLWITVTQPLE